MWFCIDCSISLGTLGFDSIIFLNKILLAISNLLASSKLLDLFLHSSCSKDEAELEDWGWGSGDADDEVAEELLSSGRGKLEGGEGLLFPSINKDNLLGENTKFSLTPHSTNTGKKAKNKCRNSNCVNA